MHPQEIPFLSAAETAIAIRSKQLSPVEVIETYLERIHRLNPSLHAYITVTSERARAEAVALERRLMAGDTSGPLFGVPVAVKDQFWTKGIPTTCGFAPYKNFIPDDEATVVRRLREAGAILLGKLNMAALAAFDDPTAPWGQCRNAWDPDRHPGGSSTGSGLAISTHLCGASLGEDTGGSARNPASWSGTTGLRPTYGRVSRHGLMPFCWYLDIAAPMGKTAEDTALVLQAIAGYDSKDPYTSKRPIPNYTATLGKPIRGLRIGIIREFDSEKSDPEVRKLLGEAVGVLQGLGAHVQEVSLPIMKLGGAMMMTLAMAEAYTVHAEALRSHHALIQKPFRSWLWAKALLPASLINDAMRARALLRQQLLEAFTGVDLLLSPTTMMPAPLYDDQVRPSEVSEEAEARMCKWLSICASYAMAAMPAISVPCGFTQGALPLPVGMQLGGPPFSEERLLQVAHAYQQGTTWHTRRAPAALA